MPALLTLVLRIDSEDETDLQEVARALQENAAQGLELEESFQGESYPIEVLGATWLIF